MHKWPLTGYISFTYPHRLGDRFGVCIPTREEITPDFIADLDNRIFLFTKSICSDL